MLNNLSKRKSSSRKQSKDRKEKENPNLIRDSNFTFQFQREEVAEWQEKDVKSFLDKFWEFKKSSKKLESSIDLGNMEVIQDPVTVGKQVLEVQDNVEKMLKITNFGEFKRLEIDGVEEVPEKISEGKFFF